MHESVMAPANIRHRCGAQITPLPILALLFCVLFSCQGIVPLRAPHYPAAVRRSARQYCADLSLEQKIGQRFISWIDGTTISASTRRLIREGFAGGVILYPWNIVDSRQLRQITAELQAVAAQNKPAIRLFVCVDQEGGRVAGVRLSDITRFPAPHYWSRHADTYFVESAAYIVGRELVSLGFNMNFAPVLDLYGTPDGSIIGDRSMGGDPDLVSRYGAAYLKGARRAGIISVIKHFPGHGSSTVDSHGSLPIVEHDQKTLAQRDLKPFITAIHSGAEALMTAHLFMPQIDPVYPVTLSKRILGDLLREELGFDGLVISDGVSMRAIADNYSLEETLILLFQAGVDMILVHSRYDALELIEMVVELHRSGAISEHDINRGVERILRIKTGHGLIAG